MSSIFPHYLYVGLLVFLFTFAPFIARAQIASQCPRLTVTLTTGSRGAQVSQLQTFLQTTGDFSGIDATISGYFGLVTEAAVKKYQCRIGLICSGNRFTTGYGAVGPLTRSEIVACKGLPAASAPLAKTPTLSLVAASSTILSGQATALSWTTQNATACALSGPAGVSSSLLTGSQNISPAKTSTYKLLCTNSLSGYTSAQSFTSITVTVLALATTSAATSTPTQLATTSSATARISVSSSLQVGTSFSADGSWSTGTNVRGEPSDVFGIANYRWDMGDGHVITGPLNTMIEYTYTNPGTYVISLTATDYTGSVATSRASVTAGTLPSATVTGTSSQSILDAVALLHGAPGVVKVPAGTYTISQPIELPAGTILEGAGVGSTLFRNTGTSTYYIRPKYGAAGDNVKISGIDFGHKITDKVDTFNMVASGGTKNLFLKNNNFHTFQNALLVSNASAHMLGDYLFSNGREAYGGAVLVASEAGPSYAKIASSFFSNNLHSIAANGATGSLPRNVGYDSIGNKFTKDIWVANDTHPGAAGRIRIEGNTFTGGNGVALQNGWGYVRNNTFVSTGTYYTIKLGPLHNNNVYLSDSGVRDMAIDHNTFQDTSLRAWLLGGRDNVSLNCRNISDTMPDITSSSQPLPEIKTITWNDCR